MPLAIRRTRFLGGNPSLSGPSVASPGPFVLGLVRFAASAAALFVKLPLETVLRRGQVAVLARRDHVEALAAVGGGPTKPQYRGTASLATVVPPGRYNGLLGTMYYIVAEEGTRQVKVKSSSKDGRGKVATPRTPLQQSRRTGRIQTMDETTMVYRKGQGLEGLWRGWKVGWWGLVGLWTVGLLGNGNGEGEF